MDNSLKIQMGRRVRTQRELLNLSQEDLANRLGYESKASISLIESGKHSIPQSRMNDFAKALEIDVAYLMGIQLSSLTEEEWKLIQAWRSAPFQTKENIAFQLRDYGMIMPVQEDTDSLVG